MLAELARAFGAYDYTAACAPRGRPSWRCGSATGRRRGRRSAGPSRSRRRPTRSCSSCASPRWRPGWRPTSRLGPRRRPAPDRERPGDGPTLVCGTPRRSWSRIEAAVGCCSVPFHRPLELARAELSRLDEPPPSAPWADRRSGRRRHLLVAYRSWREAEALLGGDAQGRQAAAAELLGDGAVGGAAELGAEPLAAEMADLARRARIELDDRRRRTTATTVRRGVEAGLTARELEVLRLLGGGLSNREIGEALFISAKTASVHVTHIFQKLNVTTRVQAAVAAHRLAPTPPD